MADLTTRLFGLDLESPFVLASGPLSFDGEAMIRAHRAGAGAVVTKTICERAARNPMPHIARLDHSLLNAERWSDLPARAWIEREIPRAKDGGVTVIASLGLVPADVEHLARPLAEAGADALEVCSYESKDMARMVSAAVRVVEVPVAAKVSANWPDVAAVVRACIDAGASGITAIDSVGPALRVDVERRRPRLGSGFGWLSGSAILPISLRVVADVARSTQVPIVGTGGVRTADDCVEMLMAGAHAIGLCSLPMVEGLDGIGHLVDGLSARLETLGYARLRDAIGAALPALNRFEAQPTLAPPIPRSGVLDAFSWDEARCTGCGICIRVCPYAARTEPDRVDLDACRSCGLCTSSCPTEALMLPT